MSARTGALRTLLLSAAIASLASVAIAHAADEFRLPAPVERKLENGLRVAVFRVPLPMVQIQLLLDAGISTEPAEASGVANLTAKLLLGGTSSRSAGAYAVEVDALGASIDATATRDYATLDGAFLARDLATGLELMSDAVVNPLFAENVVRQAQGATMRSIGDVRNSLGAFADEQLWAAVFAGHPYARPIIGAPEGVARLDRDRILRFYLAQYRPERATLAIAGDVDPEAAFAAAAEWFGRWQGKAATPAAPAGPAARLARMKIRIIDVPDARVTHVRIGATAPPRGSEDEAAFSLINALLGGSTSSRWSRLAGAAGARSAYTLLKNGGLFAGAFTAPHDSVAAVVGRLRASIRRFVASPPDEAEIAPVRATAAGVFPMRFETLGGVIGYWSGMTYAGLPVDAAQAQARIAGVRADDVAAVARRWLDPERIAVVAVGPASRLKAALARLGTVEVITIGQEAPRAQSTRTASPDRLARGRELVRLALAAHGGLARLQRIQDSTVEADATIHMGASEVRGEIIQVRKEPDRMRVDMTFAGVSTTQAIHGNRGWQGTGASADMRDLDSTTVAGMRTGFGSDVHHLLLATQMPGTILVSRGREDLGGVEAEAVEVRQGRNVRVLYFDLKTHRLIAMDQNESSGGMGFSARRIFGDFRDVQGVPWPFLEERQLEGRRVMLLEARRVSIDSGVDDVVFQRQTALPPPSAR